MLEHGINASLFPVRKQTLLLLMNYTSNPCVHLHRRFLAASSLLSLCVEIRKNLCGYLSPGK